MIDSLRIGELRRAVRGAVITPADAEYDEGRATFNALVDRRPAVIVRPADVADVAEALALADAEGCAVSVRGGGHSVAGHSFGDGAVAIDLRNFNGVSVDAAGKRALAGGGATWEEFDVASAPHGLATTGGTVADTGIGGLTLGGGIGHLQGKHGLAIDNLLSAEVVAADGRVLRASEQENVDLFWALRGGGGNFGVVTSFEFRLHPVGSLLAGLIVYPFQDAEKVIRLYRDVVSAAPDALSCLCALSGGEAGGTKAEVVTLIVCYNGPIEEGEELLRPLRASFPVIGDTVAPKSYLDAQAMLPKTPFGLRHYWKGHFLGALPDDLIDVTVEHFHGYPGILGGGVLIEPLFGAPISVPNEAMAFNQRNARFNASAIAAWDSPDLDAQATQWAREYASMLEPHSVTGAGYVNYMMDAEPAARVASVYGPEKFDRLRAIKAAHDPKNLFRFNQNIPPAGRG